jgi:hypothetical protein
VKTKWIDEDVRCSVVTAVAFGDAAEAEAVEAVLAGLGEQRGDE